MNSGLIIFIVAILVVVMIHEGGHFLVAKAFGFKATQYFLGFGPTIWSFKRGETEYGIKALPLGGFVKIIGMNPYEEVAPEDRHRAYSAKPRWQRALVIVAGSGTHFIVAFLILFGSFLTIGLPELSTTLGGVSQQIDGVTTAAVEAGIIEGDKIIGYDGKRTDDWLEIREYLSANGGKTVSLTVDRAGQVIEIEPTLGTVIFSPEGEPVVYAPPGEELSREAAEGEEVAGFLGVSPTEVMVRPSVAGALGEAAYFTWDTTKRSVVGIGQTFEMIFGGELWTALTGTGERQLDEGPLGIVGAGRIASGADNLGRVALIVGFTIFVGIMNLLPLPPSTVDTSR